MVKNAGTQQSPQCSIVGGLQNRLIGSRYGVVVGTGLKAMNWNQAIFGKYNSDSTAPLVIGMGTADDARADAFKVTSAGNGVFAGTVQATDFLDSNGDSIIGGGGSVPVDPEASETNVLTGDGRFNNAWAVTVNAALYSLNWSEEPVELDEANHRFTFETRKTFNTWGDNYPNLMVLIDGDDSNGEAVNIEGNFQWNGEYYTDNDGFITITRLIKSSGNNAYFINLLETGEGTYFDLAIVNQFEISFDDFQRAVKENILPTTLESESRYITTGNMGDGQLTVGLNMYPSEASNFGVDIDIPDLSVTPTSSTVSGHDGALYEFELTAGSEDAEFFDNWISAERQKEIKLIDTEGNEMGIMFDDAQTDSPLISMENNLVERNRNGFTIFLPGYDARELLPIQEIQIGQYYTATFGLVDYDYIQNEVISRPPEFPISHIDTGNPTFYTNTEWQPSRLYFMDTAREAGSDGYEDVSVVTSSIGTIGMSIETDSKRDSTKDTATYGESRIEFSHIEYTDDGQGTITNDVEESFAWDKDGIELVDQTTGDKYKLTISNGQVVLTNMSM